MMRKAEIEEVWVDQVAVYIRTKDDKTFSEKFNTYPRLRKATQDQRENFELNEYGIFWPEIDEDLSFNGIAKNQENIIGQILSKYEVLNQSAIARRLKIPQPLFAAYVSGAKKPSKERIEKIKEEIRKIGMELINTR